MTKNFVDDKNENRGAGILLPVFSLDGEFGVGDLGKSAYNFIDFLSESGQKCWQILPLNPTSYGDSPYLSPSAFAFNHYFISIDNLYGEGLLSKSDVEQIRREIKAEKSGNKINYAALYKTRIPGLKNAYKNFTRSGGYNDFTVKNAHWLNAYAYFMAIKEKNPQHFTLWNGEEKFAGSSFLHGGEPSKYIKSSYGESAEFYKFLQYMFFLQWSKLKEYAAQKRVKIIGDMPIYVSGDSADVWSNPDLFLLNDFVPTAVAGVPPDYFSAKGQLWGNPLYNIKEHQKTSYDWWIKRLQHAQIFDYVRIDHFRGFASFYAVPYGSKDATRGSWHSGLGYQLFSRLKAECPQAKIIAEDLGIIDDEVRGLLQKTGFPGMRVLQFGFDGGDNNPHLPQNITKNSVVYTGTHDNISTCDWFNKLNQAQKERVIKISGKKNDEPPSRALIRTAYASNAKIAVIPMHDILDQTRKKINSPSKHSGNWQYRLSRNYRNAALKNRLKEYVQTYKR